VINVDAADAPSWRDVGDIPVARVNEVRGSTACTRPSLAYSTPRYLLLTTH
jgi:hypothetical protein